MTNSSPPNPPNSSRKKRDHPRVQQRFMDEWIAVGIAFGVIGTVIFLSFGTKSLKSLEWNNLFSQLEGGLISIAEDREETKQIRLSSEPDLDVTMEEDLTVSSSSAISEPSSLNLESTDLGNLRVQDIEPEESQRNRVNRLPPPTIPNTTLPEIIIPEVTLETEPSATTIESEPTTLETEPSATIESEPTNLETEPSVNIESEATTLETEPSVSIESEATNLETEPSVNIESEPSDSDLAFKDVPKEHWAYRFIQPLGEENLIIAASGNNFEPSKLITRAGMANLVSHAFKEQSETVSVKNFNDVSPNSQKFAPISQAVKLGFMKGYSEQKFEPELLIPRYQVFVTLATGLRLEPKGNPNKVLDKFRDRNKIPVWAIPKVAAAIQSDLVINPPGLDFISLAPQKTATRAEVAAMIYQALVQSGKLKSINSTYILPKP